MQEWGSTIWQSAEETRKERDKMALNEERIKTVIGGIQTDGQKDKEIGDDVQGFTAREIT